MHVRSCVYMYMNMSIHVYVKEGFHDSTTDRINTNFNKYVHFTDNCCPSREPRRGLWRRVLC